ncbi:hypothetical protein AVEN_96494-1 [Araneus ventricosus]|uniref:Uncharacterized protein n=1 Tax=Araneus ventricosus TaxID=182803 RepID=A0A4Y2CVB3_ARAVE|nr:hypothetical protein AVEN_96494-1 [Araneus ventricosus]
MMIPLMLRLMKQCFKALNAVGECFQNLVSSFPALSLEKIEAAVFDGPQISVLVHYREFVRKMNENQKSTWLYFQAVLQNFLEAGFQRGR